MIFTVLTALLLAVVTAVIFDIAGLANGSAAALIAFIVVILVGLMRGGDVSRWGR